MPQTSSENAPSTKKRVLNLKAFLALVAGGTLLSILTGWIHAGQVVRTSSYLKATAEQALEEGDHNRAFDLFEQYMVLKPLDKSVEEKISQLLEEHGTSAKALLRAFQINERLLLDDKSRDDLRMRQIRISDKLGRYSDAAVHLKTLRDKRTDLSEVWHFSGIVAKDTGDFANAQKFFAKAVSLKDPMPESYEYLAELITLEAKDPAEAERLLGHMVADDDSAKSRRIRASWMLKQGRPQDAIPDLWTALQYEPADIRTNALLLKAVRLAANEDHSFNAEDQYRKIIVHINGVLSDNPDETKLRLYLSSALWATGERGAAINNLEYGIERDPRQFELHEVLVDYLVSDRQYERAQKVFDQIPQRVVERGRREFMRGRLLMSQKNWKAAINAFEISLGFSHDDPNISSRARVCLALCRRETGDDVAAMDAYRSLVQANPDFEGGRLGMASAYLRADQIPLAIAEYRQLLHVEGVPEFLANLMIRHILSQPTQSRDWSEVEELLRNTNPFVTDEVQRILLQADLLFAQGHPAQAMDQLDRAARRMPDREEIQRAFERLSSVHGTRLQDRVLTVLEEDPRSMEAHISVLRLQVAREDISDMVSWLNKLLSGEDFGNVNETERLLILAEAATTVADAEIATRGASEQTTTLLRYAAEARRRLASMSSQHLLTYVRFLTLHESVDAAVEVIEAAAAQVPSDVQAACWLECFRQGAAVPNLRNRVDSNLQDLIRKEPADAFLRLTYANTLIAAERYEQAAQWLDQLKENSSRSGQAFGRLAWIALFADQDRPKALELSAQGVKRAAGNTDVRSMRGLAMAESNQVADGLKVLMSIPPENRTTASHLYTARALFLAERTSEAAELVRDLSYRAAQLDPAEVRMLRQLQQALDIEPPKMTRR